MVAVIIPVVISPPESCMFIDLAVRIPLTNTLFAVIIPTKFASPFTYKVVPAIGVTAQNMATGDNYTITNKSVTGFEIAFTNSGGSGVNRTFDYIAKGF